MEKVLRHIKIIGGFILLSTLILYTFKIIELAIVQTIIFSIVFVYYSYESYILYKNKRKIGASRIIMIIASFALGFMNFIKVLQK